MKRKFALSISTVAACALIAAVTPTLAQDAYRAQVTIVPGPTVHVSAATPNLPHYENMSAGDPVHPGRLMSCSMVWPTQVRTFIDQYCYASFDDGTTWKPTLKLTAWGNQDPALAYGLGNDVYVASLVDTNPDSIQPPDPNAPPRHHSFTVIYKSTDGGHTFKETSRFQQIDREAISVDTTRGKYSGRVYLAGQGSSVDINGAPGASGLYLWRSLDGGKTFLGPQAAQYPIGSIIFGVGTSAVLSDGTYVVMFGMTKPGDTQSVNADGTANAELRVLISRDGGETFDPSSKIADIALDRPRSEGGILNQMAVDPGSRYFKDRLYAVFPEIVDNRIQIGFSYSADKGKTWSKPIVVNDDRSPVVGGHGPDHLLPAVAVNKAGVVLVTWYDRRNATGNLGWQMRAAASLDGGVTFSASVPVSRNVDAYGPSMPWQIDRFAFTDRDHSLISVGFGIPAFFVASGHTTGMAVDSSGRFFPTWIDDHTGLPQLWTAGITVDGTVMKHGSPMLAALHDVSTSITPEVVGIPQLDRRTGTVTFTAQLHNVSDRAIRGPFFVRVLNLESGLGVPEILNAGNDMHGTGAVWNFSSSVPAGVLGPHQRSGLKQLVFRLHGIRPIGQGKDFNIDLFNLDMRVYAMVKH